MQSREDLETEFYRLVNRGIILGYVWILGAGSVISLISAYQANKILQTGKTDIPDGKSKIRKCIIIGVSGLLVWVIAITIIIVFRKK